MRIPDNKKALLLDMNSTFMFGEDRFGKDEDFSLYYQKLGGDLGAKQVNAFIRQAYDFLDARYADPLFRFQFPSLDVALREVSDGILPDREMQLLSDTFAYHELGSIPQAYAEKLKTLSKDYVLGVVIDIWAPKTMWLRCFEQAGIHSLFQALSFSSDHGIVKPSAEPFERVLDGLGVQREQAVVIGDSVRRDLGGAKLAGIDCIPVGGAEHPDAIASVGSLLDLTSR